ncbi:MAG: hypothetical protein HYY87_02630 [Candidatus Levybacteria bacterium]|nr:hypothetical protein [Candidatus Levybacteria bacterium]
MLFLRQSLLLLLSFVFVFVWQKTPLSDYTIQALGFLIFLFLLLSARRKEFNLANVISKRDFLSIFTLNTLILLFIFSTGGLSSPLFFLLYFLGFGIAFVFEPATVFIFILGAILVFLAEALTGDIMGNFLRLGSLALISPLAFFFGREYRKGEKQVEQIEKTSQAIKKDVAGVLENEKQAIKSEDVEKLNDILEETEKLKKEPDS